MPEREPAPQRCGPLIPLPDLTGDPPMLRTTAKTLALGLAVSTLAYGTAQARDQIRIVGSSTVFPFATTVAENFGKKTQFKTPIIESTGSGGGLKLFCAGAGTEFPDITNASRRIKASEVELCAQNGVDKITEIKVGYDGIAFANARGGEQLDLTRKDIFTALAKQLPNENGEMVDNPNQTWADVREDLPAKKIEVLGPPPTSGTRDAFVELVMEEGCEAYEAIDKMEKDAKKTACASIREDGAYVEAGENDNLIVQKLEANPDAYGIFGYSFLDQNGDKVQGAKIEGNEPTFEAIASGDYPVSRSLFFYVKNAHADVVPGIKEYLAEFVSEDAMGEDGYLADKGLIPLQDDEYKAVKDAATNLTPLSM